MSGFSPDLGFCACGDEDFGIREDGRVRTARAYCRAHWYMQSENDPARRCPDCGGLHLEVE